MQLISTILNAFCQNLLFIYEFFKYISLNIFKNILFINKFKIFSKILGLYFIFIKKTYWIDMSILKKTETIFIIINSLFIIKKIVGIIMGNPLTIIITLFLIFIELIKLLGKV